jgi:hypothetical protein
MVVRMDEIAPVLDLDLGPWSGCVLVDDSKPTRRLEIKLTESSVGFVHLHRRILIKS